MEIEGKNMENENNENKMEIRRKNCEIICYRGKICIHDEEKYSIDGAEILINGCK